MVRLADKPIFMAIIDIESGDQMRGADCRKHANKQSFLFFVSKTPKEINA